MTKKALLLGINSYPPPADMLKAPVREAKKWARLLKKDLSFDDVKVLPEKDATRATVLHEIRQLFRNASPGDLFFIGFGGHGGNVNGWKSDTKPSQTKEHGLIVYTTDGTKGFQHASITPSDIARLLDETKPPLGTTIILEVDSCFAAAFGGIRAIDTPAVEVNPKVLFITDAVKGLGDEDAISFAEIGRLVSDAEIAKPMILAASDVKETAVEVGEPEDRRLLFSRQAINRLQKAASQKMFITSRRLVDEINPLRVDQHATIVGNTGPQDEPFGGGLPAPPPPQPQPLSTTPKETGAITPASNEDDATIEDDAAQWQFEIRILGLATFITQDPEESAYRTRIVLPFDTYAPSGPMNHFGFVEVAEQDMPAPSNGTEPQHYLRAGVKYSRWILTGHRVRFGNVPASGEPMERSAEFVYHVPGLTVVSPELEPYPEPRGECFWDFPDPSLFNGFIDLQAGSVTIGELESEKTTFKGRYSGTQTWGPRQTAVCARLTVPLERDHAVIIIEKETERPTVIYVKSGATIIAGNAREADITGPGLGEGDREHFLVYYNLAPVTVYDPGLPYKHQIPINACTVTDYP